MSSPQEVASKVWGGKPKDYKIVDKNFVRQRLKKGELSKKFIMLEEHEIRKMINDLTNFADELEAQSKYYRKRILVLKNKFK
jgi:hypothetical protein